MLRITPSIAIPEDELVERFVRASGPGGQNVNKVATAVELRYDILRSGALTEGLRQRLLGKRDRRIGGSGVVVILAQRFRSQDSNREDARARLVALVRSVLRPPKKRIPTVPTKAAKERRLSSKRDRADIKRRRAARSIEGEL